MRGKVVPAIRSDRTVVIVEARKDPLLGYAIYRTMQALGRDEWRLQIFHSLENELFLREIIRSFARRTTLTSLSRFGNITSQKAYSFLLTTKAFWEAIDTEHILIFQTDAILLKPIPRYMLQYGYVGSPWSTEKTKTARWNPAGGTGGFSLRKRSLMIEYSENRSLPLRALRDANFTDPTFPEDYYFSTKVAATRQLPPMFVAEKFGWELGPHVAELSETPCGLHKFYRHHPWPVVNRVMRKIHVDLQKLV
ncbi:hypothetical protein CYMTET_3266 [Cymbomonas tetramitiformis]|uniref:DUF5672 domain-containing protein n=1 Tax=Cymbomonas tetramitiformis TaxID=36881 RepID=A0AAE0H3N5_9CHLO|nr:hypothetical protein CYMTET_3266 [Cymbomonas tetramitiformis]